MPNPWGQLRAILLLGTEHAEAIGELLYAAAGVQDLLLTGVERVAEVANVDRQGLGQSRTSFEFVTAAAGNFYSFVYRMDIGFHGVSSVLTCRHSTPLLNTARKIGSE
ncbi:protein of unknown function [Pseudomonas sp. JV241A]|nr:protein of unknown function [Pseudomonas sp. JV241A]